LEALRVQPLFFPVEVPPAINTSFYGVKRGSQGGAKRLGDWIGEKGRESPCPDAVTSTTAKDVTTTEQSSDCVPYRSRLSGLYLAV